MVMCQEWVYHPGYTRLALHHCRFTVLASTSTGNCNCCQFLWRSSKPAAIGYDPQLVPERSQRGWEGDRDKLWRNSKPSHPTVGHPVATQRTSYHNHLQALLLCSEKRRTQTLDLHKTFLSYSIHSLWCWSQCSTLKNQLLQMPKKDFDCDYVLNQQQQCEQRQLTIGCISLLSGHSRLRDDWAHTQDSHSWWQQNLCTDISFFRVPALQLKQRHSYFTETPAVWASTRSEDELCFFISHRC